jgi:signal transduction histidine kinase
MLCLLEDSASIVRPLIVQSADGHEEPDVPHVLASIAVARVGALPALYTIVHERRPDLFDDAGQAGLLPEEWQRLFGFKHVMAVPLLSQAKAIGLMVLGYQIDQVVDDSYFNLALTLGAQIAIAFVNARLYADLQQSLQHERSARAQVVQSEKLAAIGRLAASVAHELNNPLQVIQNSLYLVRHESVLDKQAQDDLDVALTESRRMADLIDRMRETYRPTTATELSPESLNELIVEVEKLIGTHLRHNKIIYEFKPESQLPPVPCVRDQLKQVILNLSLNAVEAMPDGGRLTINTATSPEADGIWLTFTDTGHGIASEDLPNIFDPFFTRKAGGTGLGLAISYDIVQHHHGRIDVDSEPGRGTTFRIWLPTKGF